MNENAMTLEFSRCGCDLEEKTGFSQLSGLPFRNLFLRKKSIK